MKQLYSQMDSQLLVFTDLDGTLLDHETYSFKPALPAIKALEKKNIPLIFCTSKTRAETEEVRSELHNTHPFISENGGAVYVPKDYFTHPFSFSREDSKYFIIELGTPYKRIREVFAQIQTHFPEKVKGFGDLSAEEVAHLSGLSLPQARLAKIREYDEPFLLEERSAEKAIEEIAHRSNLHLTRGGRFYHLLGENDKGKAVSILKNLYKQKHALIKTAGLGDSQNDYPMLKVVDYPVLVAKPDGNYDPAVRLENLILSPGKGPSGWNEAVLKLLKRL